MWNKDQFSFEEGKWWVNSLRWSFLAKEPQERGDVLQIREHISGLASLGMDVVLPHLSTPGCSMCWAFRDLRSEFLL